MRPLTFTVPALGSTNIAVSFTPATLGQFSNVVAFATDGGGSTNPVAGQGVSAPLILTPVVSGADLRFSFETITGYVYVIQYKDSLDNPGWQPLASVTGDGTLKTITTSTSTAAQRYFRLVVE